MDEPHRAALSDGPVSRAPWRTRGAGSHLFALGPRRHRGVKLLALAGLLAGVFVVDTVTSYEIAAAVFYIAAILLAVGLLSPRGVVILAAICVGLTLVSFTLSRFGEHGAGIVNLAISISAMAIATFLALRMVAAEAAAHQAEARLDRLARMSSFGALTASIAHEVNQPLTAVVASGEAGLRWLAQVPPRIDKAESALQRIVADANRASGIVGNLRRLARGDAPQKARIDLHEIIREVVELAHAELERQDIALDMHFCAGALPVMADPLQLQQVIGNLLVNAIEAMAATSRDRRHITITSERRDDEVLVTLADGGAGLPDGPPEALFGAFWTTKPDGIGMGLTISQSIMDAHGGSLSARPNSPRGARFIFSLPALSEDQR